jgi:hypothetical protein
MNPPWESEPSVAMGIDIARGPEDTVGYLTIGSAW